jgi:hypothetical protein
LQILGQVIDRGTGVQEQGIAIRYQFCSSPADRPLGGNIILKMGSEIPALELDLLVENCAPVHPNQPSLRLQRVQIIADGALGDVQGRAYFRYMQTWFYAQDFKERLSTFVSGQSKRLCYSFTADCGNYNNIILCLVIIVKVLMKQQKIPLNY